MSIFDDEAIEQALTSRDLDSYLRVVRPSAWIWAVALTALLAGALVWALTATLPQTLQVNGFINTDGSVVAYIPTKEMPGDAITGCRVSVAAVDGTVLTGIVSEVGGRPRSQEEVTNQLQDAWVAHMLATSAYAYRAVVSLDAGADVREVDTIAALTLVLSEQRPIELLFNSCLPSRHLPRRRLSPTRPTLPRHAPVFPNQSRPASARQRFL